MLRVGVMGYSTACVSDWFCWGMGIGTGKGTL